MQFGKDRFTNNKECAPTILDGDSLMRGDDIIVYTSKEIKEVCAECNNQEACIQMLKEAKTELFNNLRN